MELPLFPIKHKVLPEARFFPLPFPSIHGFFIPALIAVVFVPIKNWVGFRKGKYSRACRCKITYGDPFCVFASPSSVDSAPRLFVLLKAQVNEAGMLS